MTHVLHLLLPLKLVTDFTDIMSSVIVDLIHGKAPVFFFENEGQANASPQSRLVSVSLTFKKGSVHSSFVI